MKFTDILKSANANLLRNKMRSFLTILAIFVGSFAIISVNAIHTGVNDYIDQQVESIGGDNYIEIASTAAYDQLASMMGTGEITEYNASKSAGDATMISNEDLDKIRKIDGVISMNPYYKASVDYITSKETDKKYNATVTLMPSGGVKADLSAGRQIDSNGGDYEILISEEYASKLGFKSPEDAINQIVT
ncbi:ABC transporter permease, partial [Candidatus Saccharibacteria bacterium]|nr:ABC transporter permease [Candidatus Saccharibacteria bacterium]